MSKLVWLPMVLLTLAACDPIYRSPVDTPEIDAGTDAALVATAPHSPYGEYAVRRWWLDGSCWWLAPYGNLGPWDFFTMTPLDAPAHDLRPVYTRADGKAVGSLGCDPTALGGRECYLVYQVVYPPGESEGWATSLNFLVVHEDGSITGRGTYYRPGCYQNYSVFAGHGGE